ncbi:MAG: sugar transferase [Candidatus Tyrphobacter sp.]
MNASLARRPLVVSKEAGASAKTPAAAPRVYNGTWRGVVVLGDIAALAISFGAATLLVRHFFGARPSTGACIVAALVVIGAFAAYDLHERTPAILRRDEIYYAFAVATLCAIVVIPGFFVTDMSLQSRVAVGLGVLLSGPSVGIVRYLLRGWIGEARLFVQPRVDRVEAPSGDVEAWLDARCNASAPTHLVIDAPIAGASVNELARAAQRRGIVLAVAQEGCAPALAVRGLVLDGSTLVQLGVPRVGLRWAGMAKRVFDVVVAACALVVTLPLVAAAALAVWAQDGRAPFYAQQRVGRDGRLFNIFKLRSMRVDAEAATGPVWASAGDGRVTRVGRILRRTSIDELPQLLNVLRGEMSIVGPRPERSAFVERFAAELPQYRERLIVAPGMTACSHLYMPRCVDEDAIAQRLAYDIYYIRNWSIAMDIALLVKTAAEVAFHRAA